MQIGEVKLSIVIPLYNEEANIAPLTAKLLDLRGKLSPVRCEFILVDDGSRDNTFATAQKIVESDPDFRLIRLARNYGAHPAVAAGISESEGDCVMYMSGDLQDPPDLIITMLEAWRKGNKIVYAKHTSLEGQTVTSSFFSRLYHRLFNFVVRFPVPEGGPDFALFDRVVADLLKERAQFPEPIVAQLADSGLPWTVVPYTKLRRAAGVSGWNLQKKFSLVFMTLLFSIKPLRLLYLLTVGLLVFSFLLALALAVLLLHNVTTLFLTFLLILTGHVLFLLHLSGVLFLGEYLAMRLNHQPRFLVSTGGSRASGSSSP